MLVAYATIMYTTLTLSFALFALVHAQTSTFTAIGEVTTSAPIPGDYTGPLRPQVHFSPPRKFMNDPNGMFVDANGTYHLYYQYNPILAVAGNQSWGHATSTDLYRWTNQPIALLPANASSYIFSGSAVIDVNNTSGFFPNQDNGVVAIYTIATYEPILLQTQGIAYSTDGGYHFTKYSGNPVLDIGSSQFRDPKVIWYEDHWVMVLAFASDYTVGIYTSGNLKEWTHASNFSMQGLFGIQWECPNLVEMPVEGTDETMYYMQVSLNPGAPLGGSISQYFPGTFDGNVFTPIDNGFRLTDFAKDNYAGQFFYGTPKGSPPIQIAWASNWEYTQVLPTGDSEDFRSVMTVPRQSTLRRQGLDTVLVNKPVDMTPILGDKLASSNLVNSTTLLDYSEVYSNALMFRANISDGATGGTLNFTFSSPVTGEYLQAGLVIGAAQPIWVNRGGVRGFENVFFTDKFSQHTVPGVTSVMGIIDRSIFEYFGNDGAISATSIFFPMQPLTVMSAAAKALQPANATVSLEVFALESGWRAQESDDGIVYGNVTAPASNSTSAFHKRLLYNARFA